MLNYSSISLQPNRFNIFWMMFGWWMISNWHICSPHHLFCHPNRQSPASLLRATGWTLWAAQQAKALWPQIQAERSWRHILHELEEWARSESWDRTGRSGVGHPNSGSFVLEYSVGWIQNNIFMHIILNNNSI